MRAKYSGILIGGNYAVDENGNLVLQISMSSSSLKTNDFDNINIQIGNGKIKKKTLQPETKKDDLLDNMMAEFQFVDKKKILFPICDETTNE